MGRRAVRVADDARWVFNRLADDYRARPGYPPALVARLVALAGGRGARVADLGAGTGHLALPLARAGARVAAVEPARAMLAALAAAARDLGVLVEAVHAAAEETGLPGGAFDLVLVADALQWVDPDRAGREAARLLRPGAAVAVVEARLAPTPFLDGLARLLAAANPRAEPRPPGRLRQLLAVAAPGAPAIERFAHEEALDGSRLEAVVRSLSYAGPALGAAALADLLARARALAAEHGGAVWRRELALTWARARP